MKMQTKRETPKWLYPFVIYTGTLIASLFVFIMVYAVIGVFRTGGALWGGTWFPLGDKFGILPMIAATFQLAVTAMIGGAFLSFGCISYLHGFREGWGQKILRTVIRMMTAVPTVVYGFASVFLLVPFVRSALGGSGYSWFTATLMLSVLITPTMVISMDKAVSEIKSETEMTAAALGLTPEQNFVHIVLPASKKWLVSSLILGFGRALGDTMIPTMLAGNAPQFAMQPLEAMRTLTAHIGLVLSSDIGGIPYYSLFVAGGILMLLSVLFNLTVRLIRGE